MDINLQFTMVLANFCGLMLKQYEPHEKTAIHRQLELRIGSGFRKLYNSKGKSKDVEKAVVIGDEVWREAVDKFAGEEISIEASSVIVTIVGRREKALGKHFKLNKGIIEKWAKPSRAENRLELENNSRRVCDFLITRTAKKLNITEKQKDLTELQKLIAEAKKRSEEKDY